MNGSRLNVLPTKMQLVALKAKRASTARGHQLLRKKLDAMTLYFREIQGRFGMAKEAAAQALKDAHWALTQARRGSSSSTDLLFSLIQACGPVSRFQVQYMGTNVAGVRVPNLTVSESQHAPPLALPGLLDNQRQLQEAQAQWKKALGALVELASVQTAYLKLKEVIQITSRRVNAIEYFLLPRIDNTIKFIQESMDEGEREETARVKRIIEIKGAEAEAETLERRKAEAEAEAQLLMEAGEDDDVLF